MRIGDKEPSTARRCTQLRQQIRLAACVHPKHALSINLLRSGGFIEFCAECMQVTVLYEPTIKYVENKKSVLANSFRNGLQNADKT